MQSANTQNQTDRTPSTTPDAPRGAPAPAKERRLDCSEAPADADPRKPAAGRGVSPRAR